MLLRQFRPSRQFSSTFFLHSRRYLNTTVTSPSHGPLNILFCGADAFSLPSLKALHHLSLQSQSNITSLTVLCRPDKYTGRGYKALSSPPIKSFAQSLDLPIIQRDTFTGWTPSSPVDLVITVSFGLLVPARILQAARYGGVNVHPSLLPDLRGPAPIQRALLQGRKETGVSLQTMHPERFDAGKVLDRRKVDVPENAGVGDMIGILGPLGAGLLGNYVSSDAFADGVRGHEDVIQDEEKPKSSYAAKLTKQDQCVDWETWDAEQVLRYDRVLGNLWDISTYRSCLPAKAAVKGDKRVSFQGPWSVLKPERDVFVVCDNEGVVLCQDYDAQRHFALETADGLFVSPTSATIEGEKKGKGLPTLVQGLERQAQEYEEWWRKRFDIDHPDPGRPHPDPNDHYDGRH
ncbi:hypothetical protein TI39_contig405g00003 [Zymoseptoria brevis]|uniref:methionyl-tRNA formyltransferase n=1 Tax=Zymoseptoria brevis TaxID=1047168 RepID=A0A0F4GMV4_9PEZI|nr:hypothetical protein TI39_contig405g00003 [Zymoseptoria brevis]